MGIRDEQRDGDNGQGVAGPGRWQSAGGRRGLPAGAHDLCGQVLFATVSSTMVQLDVVADSGPLPVGTPFVVTAELPGGFLGAVVESVVARWSHDGCLINARVSRYAGHTRVDLVSSSTRVVLDVETVAVPQTRAA